MAQAEINTEVLMDGTIKFTTDRIPDEHHADAEAFMDEIEKLMGGKRETEHRRAGHVHAHKKTEQHVRE